MKRSIRGVAALLAAGVLLAVAAPIAGAGQPGAGDTGIDLFTISDEFDNQYWLAGRVNSPTKKCRVGRRVELRVNGQLRDFGPSTSRGTFGLSTNDLGSSDIVVPAKKVKVRGDSLRCRAVSRPVLLQ